MRRRAGGPGESRDMGGGGETLTQHYAAIIYKPTVMLFGLQNAPTLFQRHMNYILRKLIATGKVFIYIDDILITTENLEEHRKLTHGVLQPLQDDGLSVRKRKCEFEVPGVMTLGLRITEGLVCHSPKKCRGIQDWPTPTTVKMVQEYVGLLNYFRRFIKDFATIAWPLYDVTGDKGFYWGKEQQHALDTLIKILNSDAVLAIPQDKGKWRMEVDASNYATGGVLSQQQENSIWRPAKF